jgi:DNA repair and recombination RAD54-like protein
MMSEDEEEKNMQKKRAPAVASKAKAASNTAVAALAAPSRRDPAAVAASTAPPLFHRARKVNITSSAAIATEKENAADKEDADEEEDEPVLSQLDAARRAANVAALLGGSLAVARRPIAQSLSVAGAEAVLRSAFCSPLPGAPAASETLKRKLAKRRAFVPWGSSQPLPAFRASTAPALPVPEIADPTVGDKGDDGPPPGEPLCLWEEPWNAAAEGGGRGAASTSATTSSSPRARIMVDPMLTRWLRPHQREGVAFMFECVTGIKGFDGRGCLLADDVSGFLFFPF